MTNTDHVIQAIEVRKREFIQLCNDQSEPIPEWYFKHICTVLNHTKKIFEHSVEDMIDVKLRDEIL